MDSQKGNLARKEKGDDDADKSSKKAQTRQEAREKADILLTGSALPHYTHCGKNLSS